MTPGKKFREALMHSKPLKIVGVINAYVALMAQRVGFQALYLSGSGVASASYGLPDLGLTSIQDVLADVYRITAVADIPLLVDIDTGWGSPLMIERSIKAMEKAGAAAVHLEDQVFHKRCGHLSGKQIVSIAEMSARIQAAAQAKRDKHFAIIARTDAYAIEGLEGAIERGIAYKNAGADMLFPEALASLEEYRIIKEAVAIPILANVTEFGVTPLFSAGELSKVNVDMVLYPLSANRAMNLAALKVFEDILNKGTQRDCLELMQTREEAYGFLNYENYVKKLNSE